MNEYQNTSGGHAPLQRGIVQKAFQSSTKIAETMTVTNFIIYWAVISFLLWVPFYFFEATALHKKIEWLPLYIIYFVVSAPVVKWLYGLVFHGKSGWELASYSNYLLLFYGLGLSALFTKPFTPLLPDGKRWLMIIPILVITKSFIYLAKTMQGTQVFSGGLRNIFPRKNSAPSRGTEAAIPHQTQQRAFKLQLGVSNGRFTELGHQAGIAGGQHVSLSQSDASMNTIIFGGIGSGKTTSMINPLLMQIMQQDAGALIFDIKTDFINEVRYLSNGTRRSFEVIGEGGLPFNLLQGLTPEVASSYLKSAFTMSSNNSEAFWTESAVELCRNGLGLLQFRPKDYSLTGLYDVIFDIEYFSDLKIEILQLIKEKKISDSQIRLAKMNLSYFSLVYEAMEEKVQSNVRATCAQVLSPFQHPDLIDAFCTSGSNQARMENLLDGAIYLVEIPVTKYGKDGARYAYLFTKLRFMTVMKARRMMSKWNQDRPVAFICDEYQSIIDSVSDNDFWDKSRSSKCMGIVSMQGLSSMIDAVGHEKAAKTILQNFRQVICFQNNDEPTINYINFLMGKVDIQKVSETQGNSTSDGKGGSSSTTNYSRATSTEYRNVCDAQLFRQLEQRQAVCILNIGGQAMDDVLNTAFLAPPK